MDLDPQSEVHVRTASVGMRILMACVGVITLGLAALITAGGALLAPLGMTVARAIVQRRKNVPMYPAAAATPQLSPRANRAFAMYGAVAGALFIFGLLGTIIGSLGWAASLPLAYAINGRWRTRRRVGPDAASAESWV
jgi:hypothetical protein